MLNKGYRKREFQYILFIIPALVIVTIFFLYPVISTLFYSFTDLKGVGSSWSFNGVDNYKKLFATKEFWNALKNNLYFTIIVTVLQSLIAFVLALALDANLKAKNVFRTYFFAPVVISSVAISFIWVFMYDPNTGVINELLEMVGLGVLKQNWLGDKKIAMFSIALVQIWQWVGFEMVIFMAGLNNVPRESYEVAKVEGSSYLYTLIHVVIPQIKPTILMAIVLTTIGCFKVFDIVFIMTNGGPNHATEVLAQLLYEYAFKFGKMGFASAISMVLLLVIMVVGFGQMYLLRDKE